jgi:hypothetical protein
MAFSKPDTKTFTITPIGAATVEAMPDKKLVAKINRVFKKTGKCPTSEIFKTQKEINDFYARGASA